MSGSFFVLPCFIEISVFNANSVDPDQTPHSAASRMRRLIWVYTVCHCPLYGMLGINGLNYVLLYNTKKSFHSNFPFRDSLKEISITISLKSKKKILKHLS